MYRTLFFPNKATIRQIRIRSSRLFANPLSLAARSQLSHFYRIATLRLLFTAAFQCHAERAAQAKAPTTPGAAVVVFFRLRNCSLGVEHAWDLCAQLPSKTCRVDLGYAAYLQLFGSQHTVLDILLQVLTPPSPKTANRRRRTTATVARTAKTATT